MLPKCEAVKLSQAEANVKAEVMQKKQVVVYSHADAVLVIIIIIACIYAEPFFMKPNVFLKYESVNSECTPVTRNRAV